MHVVGNEKKETWLKLSVDRVSSPALHPFDPDFDAPTSSSEFYLTLSNYVC